MENEDATVPIKIIHSNQKQTSILGFFCQDNPHVAKKDRKKKRSNIHSQNSKNNNVSSNNDSKLMKIESVVKCDNNERNIRYKGEDVQKLSLHSFTDEKPPKQNSIILNKKKSLIISEIVMKEKSMVDVIMKNKIIERTESVATFTVISTEKTVNDCDETEDNGVQKTCKDKEGIENHHTKHILVTVPLMNELTHTNKVAALVNPSSSTGYTVSKEVKCDYNFNYNNSHINNDHQLSEYEKFRQRNIERNNKRLASLGLLSESREEILSPSAPPPRKDCNVVAKRRSKPCVTNGSGNRSSLPIRRSNRVQRMKGCNDVATDGLLSSSSPSSLLSSGENKNALEVNEEKKEEDMVVFVVSPVMQYAMDSFNESKLVIPSSKPLSNSSSSSSCAANAYMHTAATTTATDRTLHANNKDGNVLGFEPVGINLVPPKGLNAIYSLNFHPNFLGTGGLKCSTNVSSWIVGAGKSGMLPSNNGNGEHEHFIHKYIYIHI